MNKRIKTKLIISWALFLIVCIAIILVVTSNKSKDLVPDEVTTEQTSSAAQATEPTTADAATEEAGASNPLEKDKYPEVNKLIERVLKALAACDMDTLKKLDMHPATYKDSSEFEKVAEWIEGYKNVECYTKKGPEPDTYIVYVSQDCKLNGIDTPAPGMFQYYVVKDSGGKYKIDTTPEKDMEASVSNFIHQVSSDDDTLALMDAVTTKYKEAISKDPDLKKYVKKKLEK